MFSHSKNRLIIIESVNETVVDIAQCNRFDTIWIIIKEFQIERMSSKSVEVIQPIIDSLVELSSMQRIDEMIENERIQTTINGIPMILLARQNQQRTILSAATEPIDTFVMSVCMYVSNQSINGTRIVLAFVII